MGINNSWLFQIVIWVFSLSLICCSFSVASGDFSGEGSVYVNGKRGVGKTDSDFICATLDWWPPQKCDYGTCSWGHASLLDLDLSNKIFLNAIKAFTPLKIRLGGTLQDKLVYQTEGYKGPCTGFALNSSQLFSFNEGCLPLSRWDELNAFFNKSGAVIIFGLNALTGRHIQSDSSAIGAWDSTNAEALMRYTVKKGYTIHGWELGNELSGNGIGVRITAEQYASDTFHLHSIVENIYKDAKYKPLVIAPGGFFEADWYKEFVDKANSSLDAITHHIYNLGPGSDEHLVEKILDPSYLDGEADTFSQLHHILSSSGTSVNAWVGEAGGAYNSGRNHVSNAFIYSFWYLDQLGMSASYDTKTYCRQSLIGGNYGLLNTTNFVPNPDYYSALLWHRLMGRTALSTSYSGTKKIRAYTHCAKHSGGITLLLINLDGNTTVEAKVAYNGTVQYRKHTEHTNHHRYRHHYHHHHHSHGKRSTLFHHKRGTMKREEYHLTAKDGDLQSQTMLLNGKELTVDSSGHIPQLKPKLFNSSHPITIAPHSILFAHIPYVSLPACTW